MKIQGFLDHLLKSSSGNGSVLNADFGKGAITGGALGLLLGKNKTSRKLATYGGLAAIGVMAYRAYNDYKQQQAASRPARDRRRWTGCRPRRRNCTARRS